MNRIHHFATSATLALAISAGGVGAAWAQSTEDHAAHHPAQDTATAPADQQNQDSAQGGMPMMQRTGGTAQPGNAGPGVMMGGGMQQMMKMTQMMGGGTSGPMGMMAFDHTEGRLAFLKAELGITDAQQPQWNVFADAMRTQAKTMQPARQQTMQGGMPSSWPDRLARQKRMLATRLVAINAIEGPARSLYDSLSAEQKQKADELMGHPMVLEGM